jgi:hypothetical protein
LGNLVNVECPIIPVPLFRTDDWDYPEAPFLPDEYAAHRIKMKNMRLQADEMARLRIIREAEQILKESEKLK